MLALSFRRSFYISVECLYGLDLVLPKTCGNESVPEYATGVAEKLEKVQNFVRHNLNDPWLASCKWYNRKVKPKSFDVGQTVRVYYPQRYRGRTPKWQSYYSAVGTVVEKFNDATYLVKSKSWKSPQILHCDKLKS